MQNLLVGGAVALVAIALGAYIRTERWRRAWRRLRRDKFGVVSLCVVALFIGIGLLDLIVLPSSANAADRITVLDLFSKIHRRSVATAHRLQTLLTR